VSNGLAGHNGCGEDAAFPALRLFRGMSVGLDGLSAGSALDVSHRGSSALNDKPARGEFGGQFASG
jgi:hypothetical protein